MLPMPKTELYLTEHCGWGVKALEPIPRGAFIVEYAGKPSLLLPEPPLVVFVLISSPSGHFGSSDSFDTGEVVDDQECRRRMAQAKDNGQKDFYMMELAPGLIIDARLKCAPAAPSSCSCNSTPSTH